MTIEKIEILKEILENELSKETFEALIEFDFFKEIEEDVFSDCEIFIYDFLKTKFEIVLDVEDMENIEIYDNVYYCSYFDDYAAEETWEEVIKYKISNNEINIHSLRCIEFEDKGNIVYDSYNGEYLYDTDVEQVENYKNILEELSCLDEKKIFLKFKNMSLLNKIQDKKTATKKIKI